MLVKKCYFVDLSTAITILDIINIMDDSVGQIVKKLADKNMLHDSIIIFLSDNGAPVAGELMNSGSNWPLRGVCTYK